MSLVLEPSTAFVHKPLVNTWGLQADSFPWLPSLAYSPKPNFRSNVAHSYNFSLLLRQEQVYISDHVVGATLFDQRSFGRLKRSQCSTKAGYSVGSRELNKCDAHALEPTLEVSLDYMEAMLGCIPSLPAVSNTKPVPGASPCWVRWLRVNRDWPEAAPCWAAHNSLSSDNLLLAIFPTQSSPAATFAVTILKSFVGTRTGGSI